MLPQRFRPTPLCLALAFALGGLPTVATAAQDDPRHDEEIADLSGIVVRANPLARTAEDLARPVAVLAGEQLDEAKAASLGETVSRLPGVQSSFFGAGVGRPVIRGLEGARVQVLSDGLSAGDVSTVSADHAVSIEPFLANQIEVLKGPATLLYGSGAIGGAVNVIDGRIPETATSTPLEGRAELRAGSVNDERTGMLRLDGTSASGRVVFHFDALHRETGDYDIPGFAERADLHHDDHDHDHDVGHAAEDAARGQLPNSFVRTDSGALGVSYIGDAGFLGVGHSLFNTRYGVPGHSHAASDDHGHAHDHDESESDAHGAVHVVMDQRRNEVRGGLDDIGAFESLRIKLAHTDYTHTEYEGDTVGTVFDNTTLEGRVELVHRAIAGWQGAVGLQLSERDFSAVGDEAFVPDSNARDAGLFWIGERDFGAFGVELGLRHDRNRIDVAAADAIGPSREFDATSASLAMRWNVSRDLHLSFGLDRAQRTPTAEELYSTGMHVATQSFEFGNPDLDPETANRAEIGLHWHHGPLRLGASLFQVRYDDFIYLADTGLEDDGLALRAWHQADARFHGGEVEAQWDFAETEYGAWSLRSFADVVRGRLDGGASRRFDASIPHGDHVHDYTAELVPEGNLPRIAPRRLGSELRWQGAQWRASLGAVRYAGQDHVAQFETTSPGYTLVHASVAWHRDGAHGNAMELFVDGRNLLDEEARVHTSVLKDLAPLAGRGVTAGVRVFF
ncbi:TonB-dependent receptor [Luteimonas sp. MC1828]|uniref:TonB-dependent receptor n=1 Tax=Luteimonas sp. MC1828 TaxID=2799787 RepID=UPI0018F25C0A|nr:TonB-dependent receptor [Luteimonas sp. MC1828]MBJ7573587.1 TonB-dependent receptor [Luteimonas sp. MC1828]